MPPISIAIADDHKMMRKGLCTIINHFPQCNILIEADNGLELLNRIEEASVRPDICIVDISMPILNGYDTTLEIKKRWPEIKILAISMYSDELCILKMIANGATGFVLKDEEPEQLQIAINNVATNGIHFPHVINNRLVYSVQQKRTLVPTITEKENQLLHFVCSDLTYAEIAKKMSVSTRSVEGYRDSLFQKLNVHSRISLALFAIRLGIVPIS